MNNPQMSNGIYKVSDRKFIKIVNKSESYAEILRHLGIYCKGGNYQTIKNRLTKLNIKFTPSYKGNFSKIKSLKKILTKNSNYNRNRLKERLIKTNF